VAKSGKRNSSGLIGTLSQFLGSIWRAIAKGLGASIRVVTRGAKDLDVEHQRDGLGLILLIIALVAAATTWWKLDNLFGNAAHAFFFGAVGRLALAIPPLFMYFAFRLFRSPQDKAANGRIVVGSFLLIISSTGLIHILNPSSVDTGATAMREGGGWIGYAISSPLIALVTDLLAIPILILILLFSLLVITATPFSRVIGLLSGLLSGAGRKVSGAMEERRERKIADFEISETPPFETPLVQEFASHPEDEIDEVAFDQEFTVEIPKSESSKASKPQRPVQLVPPIPISCQKWNFFVQARQVKVRAK